jgi:hypothetical protein
MDHVFTRWSRVGRGGYLACVALVSLGAVYVFRGGLKVYFAQEDFRGLAVAAGVYPPHNHLWRYVSVQMFMDVFHPLFRDRAWPYHAVSLALHCLNASALFLLLSRALTRPAALIGAAFFAVHPALFTALYWQSARADILAATFALLTLILALREGRERWLAVPAFALSLLSKESTLPLPEVIVLVEWWRGGREPAGRVLTRNRLIWALFVMSTVYLVYLIRPSTVGIGMGLDPGAAYGFDFGSSLFQNLLTYVGWTVDLAMLRRGLRFVDHQNPALYPLAIGVMLTTGILALWPALRRNGWLVGLASFFLLLVPVLPLKNHTYHYYLYAPLLAAGLCVAALADALMSLLARSAPSPAKAGARVARTTQGHGAAPAPWTVALVCWMVLVWNGARVVRQMETRPSPLYPGLRGDPIVDRAIIAERAIETLRAASIPAGSELVMVLRERLALIARIVRGTGEHSPPPQEIYPETNVRAAVFDGYGIRALVRGVDSVRFAIALGQPTPKTRYGIYAPTGEVEVFDAVSIDSLLRTSWVTRW